MNSSANTRTKNRNNTIKANSSLAKAKQQGAVMISVLLVLVLITLMGVSSMKQGMFQARLGSATVTSATCFMAAESGINAVYREFQAQQSNNIPITDVRNFMNQASGTQVKHCLGKAGLISRTDNSCGESLSEYSSVQVALLSRPADSTNPSESASSVTFNSDIDKGGTVNIYTDSRCEVTGADMAVTNTQAWQHRSPNSLPKHTNTNI